MKRIFFILFILLTITACSGGGDSPPATGNTGFIDIEGHEFNPEMISSSSANNSVYITYYQADGSIESYHQIYDWLDGQILYGNEYTYTYNSDDLVWIENNEFTYKREGLNENIMTSIEFSYENLQIKEKKYYDQNMMLTKLVSNTYVDGKLSQSVEDDGADAMATNSNDVTYQYEYNGSNQLAIKTEYLYYGFEIYTVYDYYPNGKKSKETIYEGVDNYNTLTAARVNTFTYDASENLVTIEEDFHQIPASVPGPDSFTDVKTTFQYGPNNQIQEKIVETFSTANTRKDTTTYRYEVRDSDKNGTPDISIVYVNALDTVYDEGSGYPEEIIPNWLVAYNNGINDTNTNDGYGLNWEGHATGTCSTCGNMIGEVNKILMGF